MLPSWRRTLWEVLILLLLGSAIGLLLNQRLLRNVLSGRVAVPPVVDATAPASLPEPVALDEVRQLLAHGALAVDARAEELYAQGHLPGARSLPLAAAQGRPLAGVLPLGPVLVVYCSGYGCSDSFELALLLLRSGYRAVRVFEGGFPAWREAGLPVVTGDK